MSVRCLTLLLSLYLSFQKAWTDTSLDVTSGLQYSFKDPDSVTVICEYNWEKGWEVAVKLKANNNVVCETSQKRRDWSQEGNQTKFHLKNFTSDQKKLSYTCEVFRHDPLPVLKGEGHAFRLFPESHILPNIPCNSTETTIVIPPPEIPCRPNTLIWAWALIGLMLLLCLYSLIITILYITLKIKWSQELNDTLTYVPMQKQVRQKNADKNAEYMDMRKVPPMAATVRDMNHNSHRLPAAFM
ncbi:uncharacterized protein si:ch211-67e16.3 isoform X1 [Astyanax mexicanus]|uniref:uncharacterized protein si:ch211-67e16.3 isoform X1 n=1 Tax=Astyanax mexicanus TaxID=7994 RepID=UPI0020CAC866|nr:uncharacterized protein si:ch211-67e16.3 isoform X1 [Astyanax mexicanus]